MSLNEIIVALMALAGVAVPAYFVYKRGKSADDSAAETAAAAQVYAGYGGLLQRYQESDAECRRRLADSEARLAALEAKLRGR